MTREVIGPKRELSDSVLLNRCGVKLPPKYLSLYHRLMQLQTLVREASTCRDSSGYILFMIY